MCIKVNLVSKMVRMVSGHKRWSPILALLLPVVFSARAADSVDLTITGVVMSSACTIVPDDKHLTVDFHTLNSRDLDFAPSAVKPFKIRLERCDISTLKTAKVTIRGQGANGKEDLLALDAASAAKGFAIGFKQGKEGTKALPLNTESESYQLTAGNSELILGAYAQKLSGATISPGIFSAKATVEIVYK